MVNTENNTADSESQSELSAVDPAEATAYQRTKLTFSLVSMSLNIVIPLVFLFSGGSEAIRNLVEGWTSVSALIVVLYMLVAGAGLQVTEFPLEI